MKETRKLVKWFHLVHLTQFGDATVCPLVTRTNNNNTKINQIGYMGNTPQFQWYITFTYDVGGDEMTEGYSR